ncbi:MAG: tetratricopeptide repeat protein [Alphaproteobacteria bacterium]|nr:tetratricopeptide repeat protein [Alphaproteobacteria bacterium]
MSASSLLIHPGPVLLDLERGVVSVNGVRQEGTLEPMHIAVLRHCVAHPGRLLSYEELLEAVWGDTEARARSKLFKAVSVLRARLGRPLGAQLLRTRPGKGYVFTGVVLGAPPPAPPRETADRFVGRAADMDRLLRRLQDAAGPTLLVGPGGVGKTRLATEAARLVSMQRARPVVFVSLVEARTRPDVLVTVAHGLGLRMTTTSSAARAEGRVTDALRALSGVLVLDNLEQVDEDGLRLLSSWCAEAQGASIVATSRFVVPAFEARPLQLEPMGDDDALALLGEAVAAAGGEPVDRSALVALTRLLGGLPLALRMAASHLAFIPAPQLVALLQASGLGALTDPAASAARHRSPRAAVGWTWALLDEDERAALLRMSVFRAPFTPEAFAHMCGGGEPDRLGEALGLLGRLRRRCVVLEERPSVGGQRRLILPEAIRQFARDALDDPAVAEERHATFILSRCAPLAERAELGGAEALASLLTHYADLQAVFERSLDRAPERAARAALILALILERQGPFHLLDGLLERAGGQAEVPTDLQVRVQLSRAAALRRLGHRDALGRALLEAERLARSSGAPKVLARVHNAQGLAALEQGHVARAESCFVQAIQEALAAGDHRQVARACANLSLLLRRVQRVDEAMEAHHRAMEYAERADDRLCMARALGNVANLHLHAGRFLEARAALGRELVLHHEMGDLVAEARARANLGALLLEQGHLEEAEPMLSDALDMHRMSRSVGAEAIVQTNLALLELERGHHASAQARLLDALETQERIGDHKHAALTGMILSLLLLELGATREALRCCALARARADEVGDGGVGVFARLVEVLGRRAQGAPGEAEAALQDARARAGATPDEEIAQGLALLAGQPLDVSARTTAVLRVLARRGCRPGS